MTLDLAQSVSLRLAALMGLFAMCVGNAVAASENFYLALDGGYKRGDFGTTVVEQLYSLAATVGRVSPSYEVSISAPFLRSDNETAGSESGLGDVVVGAGYVLFEQNPKGLALNGSLAIKLPTADEKKGLGSGETDIGAYLTLTQHKSFFSASIFTGYVAIGDTDEINYNNIVTYGIGASKNFSWTGVYVSMEGRTAATDQSDSPLEVHLGVFHILDIKHTLTADVFLGLSDGSPDEGISLGVVRWF